MTVKWEPFHQHCIIFFALSQKGINFGVTYIDGLTSTLSVQTLLTSLLALTLEDFMRTPIRNKGWKQSPEIYSRVFMNVVSKDGKQTKKPFCTSHHYIMLLKERNHMKT